jgi:mannose-6-phosphate isomerase-like protein (cupin superfamily)
VPADPTAGLRVVRPGQGERFGNVEFLARSEDTPRFNVGIITVQPHKDGPELHVHQEEDDSFYVLEGELTIQTADGEFTAPAGTFVLVPPGVVHTFCNRGDEIARILNVHAPAGFDRRVRE